MTTSASRLPHRSSTTPCRGPTICRRSSSPTPRRCATVQKAIPALAYLATLIGDPAVRHRGTIGGSIANNDPAADYPAAVLALGATVKTNKRTISADEFFQGPFSTALAHRGITYTLSVPTPGK